MNLKEKIQHDVKDAMKQGLQKRKDTLRMLLSEIQHAQTAVSKETVLDEKELLAVASRYKKKLEKSLENYPDGPQKKELLEEISIVSEYLPKEASQEDIEKIVAALLKNTEEKNFGKLMKLALEELGSSESAKLVGEILKKKLV